MSHDEAAALTEALEGLLEEWSVRLDRELTSRMRDVLATARDAHRTAMEEAGLVVDDDGASIPFDALRRYRGAVHSEVVRPLLQFANEVDPGRRVGRLVDALSQGLIEVAEESPASVTRAAPADQYRPAADDGLLRRSLKGVFRGGRGLGNLLRRTPPEQAVPLRSIAAAAIQQETPSAGRAVSEGLFQHYARPLQRMGMALSAWMRDWMPVENRRHHPEAHLAEEDRVRLARLREDLRAAAVEGDDEVAVPVEETEGADGASGDTADAPAPGEPQAALEEARPGEVAARLQQALDEVAELPSPEVVLADLRLRFDRLEERLGDRIREGGTLFARTGLANPRRVAQRGRREEARREQWRGWYDATIDRVRVTDEFLSLRTDTGEILTRLLGGTLEDSVFFLAGRIEAGREGLLGLRDRTLASDHPSDGEDGEVAAALASDASSVEAEARRLLEKRLLAPLRERNPRAGVEQAASEAVEALGRRLGYVPLTLSVHPIRALDGVVDPVQPVRRLPLREIARQGFDVLHLEGLRTTPAPLLDYLAQVEGECRQVVEMVAYSLSSAREALLGDPHQEVAPDDRDPDAPPPPEPGEGAGPGTEQDTGIEAAQTLWLEGLARAADSLDVILAPAVTAWDEFATGADEMLEDGRERMHSRLVVEGTVQEQLRDVRSLVRSWWRARLERARELRLRYGPPLRRRVVRMQIRARRLIRRGRSAMAGADAGKAERASEVLGRIPALLEPLPLIYRRLFTFQPLTDGGLMVGREDDQAWLVGQYERWKEGWCPPVVLTGSMAVGHTSFLNVMAQELLPGDGTGAAVRIVPSARYLDETSVATRLALGLWGEKADGLLSETGDAGDVMSGTSGGGVPGLGRRTAWTFSRLEQVLRERGEERAVFLERLEHFLIRVPGGCGLAERFLAFQSRTAQQVFWVNSVSDPAWKLLSTTEPHTRGLVQLRRLEPPDRSTMEELLLTRHRRSGVPLEFVEYADVNPLVRRRLKRARSEKERQEILRTDFFDWLFRASRASVLMAILLWLRSADFTSRPGWLRLKPSQPIRFTFLEEMDLTASFTLKAFLEHESLTLEEYSRVFGVTRDESFQILEVLRGKVLIDRLDTAGSLPVPVRRLEEGERYRIPPIITHVIAQNLRDQNILH